MSSMKSPNNCVGEQQALLLTNQSHAPDSTPTPVNLGSSAQQHKHTEQNSKNDTSNSGALQYQNQNDTTISTSNGSLYYQDDSLTIASSKGGPSPYTPSSAHTISCHTKSAILQHTQTTVQYHTPLHQLNNAAAGINSSYNNEFDTTVALKPASDAVADSTPDATSDTPSFVHHKDITTAAASAFTPISNGAGGVYNLSLLSSQKISTNKPPNLVRASVVTPTNVDEAVNFIRNHLGAFDIDTRKAIVERLYSLENGTVSHDESKSLHLQPLHLQPQQCIKSYPPEQLYEKVLTKDTSTLDEEVAETIVYETSYNSDVDDEGNNDETKVYVEESMQGIMDLATEEEREDTNSNEPAEKADQIYINELGRDLVDCSKDIVDQEEVATGVDANNSSTQPTSCTEKDPTTDIKEKEDKDKVTLAEEEVEEVEQSDVDPLDCETVLHIPHNEEEETVEEDEEDDESADQQNGLTIDGSKKLDKISNWTGNAAAITKVLDSLVPVKDKEKLKDKGYEKAKIMEQIVEISLGAEKIGELLVSLIDKEKLSAAEIGEKLKHQFEGMKEDPHVIKTCLLDNTQTTPSAPSTSSL